MIETAVRIEPFAVATACPKCGAGEIPDVSTSTMTMTAPSVGVVPDFGPTNGPPFAVAFPMRTPLGDLKTRYCGGGLEPEAPPDPQSFPGMLEGMSAFFASLPGTKPLEIPQRRKLNICAGITKEHLHQICGNCGFEFLMSCKDAEVNQ